MARSAQIRIARREGGYMHPFSLSGARGRGLDLHRGGRARGGSVEDGLDVVAVGIEHEGPVVPRMVVALARAAVVAPAGGQRRAVEGPHLLAAGRLEREVDARHRTVG